MNPIQAYYPEAFAHCYGCGRLNLEGHGFKTYWDPTKRESRTEFTPMPYHTAIPGFVYGGLLASLVDCHSTATGSVALKELEATPLDQGPYPRCVTASLEVQFLKPTPLGPTLVAVGRVRERTERKVVVETEVYADGILTVRGKAVVVRIPESMGG